MSISFSPLHFILYRGKLITFGTVRVPRGNRPIYLPIVCSTVTKVIPPLHSICIFPPHSCLSSAQAESFVPCIYSIFTLILYFSHSFTVTLFYNILYFLCPFSRCVSSSVAEPEPAEPKLFGTWSRIRSRN